MHLAWYIDEGICVVSYGYFVIFLEYDHRGKSPPLPTAADLGTFLTFTQSRHSLS